jgi:hypothetical protein
MKMNFQTALLDVRQMGEADRLTVADSCIAHSVSRNFCSRLGGIKSVTLVEVQHSLRRNRLRITYRSDDLFDSIKAGDVVMPPADQIVGASFLVRFSDSAKQRTVKIVGSNKLSVVHDSDKALMEEWLDVSGFVIHRPVNENETEVLASA